MIAQVPATAVVRAPFIPTLSSGDAVPNVALVDRFGHRLSFHGTGEPVIISFAYTRCPDPDMCALVTAKFARMQRLLAGSRIRLIEVTLDPRSDRPAVLRRYAAAVGARAGEWEFATGRPADIAAFAERFGIVSEPSAGGSFRHTDAVAILSSSGILTEIIGGTQWSASDVAADARDDAGLGTAPFARFALALFAGASAICGGRRGGLPLAGALALFTISIAFFSALAARTIVPAFFDRTS